MFLAQCTAAAQPTMNGFESSACVAQTVITVMRVLTVHQQTFGKTNRQVPCQTPDTQTGLARMISVQAIDAIHS